MAAERCKTCRFAGKYERRGVVRDLRAPAAEVVCRRYPPTGVATGNHVAFTQPVMSAEGWCGEWRAAPPPAETAAA